MVVTCHMNVKIIHHVSRANEHVMSYIWTRVSYHKWMITCFRPIFLQMHRYEHNIIQTRLHLYERALSHTRMNLSICHAIRGSFLSLSKFTCTCLYVRKYKCVCQPPIHTHERRHHQNMLKRVFHIKFHLPLNTHVCVHTHINSSAYVLFLYTSIFVKVQCNMILKSIDYVICMIDSFHIDSKEWIDKCISLYT